MPAPRPHRAFRLTGPGAAMALDLLHVHADVLGAIEEVDRVTVWLDGDLPALAFADVTVSELPASEANLTATGLEHDAPVFVLPDLLVRPPWVERPAGYTGIELIVPRGMAFGSGEHGSTQAALRCLHAHWGAPDSFADVGTGSGILALYAAARGCACITACDIEEPSVVAARALLPGAIVTLGGPDTLPALADCITANLTAAELHAALPAILDKWTRRAPLILSGMRAHEEQGVRDRLPAAGPAVVVDDFRAFAVPPQRLR